MKKELTFEEKVFRHLDRMPAGTILLTELCRDKKKGIEVVKKYIDQKAIHNGYCTEFVKKYTAIRKWDIILRTSIERFKESIN